MNLSAYLERIGFDGPVRRDLDTLRRVHLAHQLSIPFENLDVQLGRPLSTEPARCFEKIVERRRGGWCYEMNGLMGWALTEMGFEVSRLSAGVMRESLGDEALGNHLCLLVNLGSRYLVDVGFGGSLSEPLSLRESQRTDLPYQIGLSRVPDGYWRFTELAQGKPFSFDFRADPADEALLARKHESLRTDVTSSFVQNLVVQRRTRETHVTLRGRVLSVLHSSHQEKTLIGTPHELVSVLRERFGLDVPETSALWPSICARHDVLFTGGER